jgi:hypothetical protein
VFLTCGVPYVPCPLYHALSSDDLSVLVTETLSRAPLQNHRGRVRTIGVLQQRIAREGGAGLSTQEARLELDKLISRRLLLLGVPCDLPVLTVAQGANDENGLPETIPDIAE